MRWRRWCCYIEKKVKRVNLLIIFIYLIIVYEAGAASELLLNFRYTDGVIYATKIIIKRQA